jgi:hypothetical protein
LNRCCPNSVLPKKIYATFLDVNGIWPCINGVTLELEYNVTSVLDPDFCELLLYQTAGPIKDENNYPVCNVKWGAFNIPSCNGNGYVATNNSCASPDYSCSSDVYVDFQIVFFNGCFPQCLVETYLGVYVQQKVLGLCRNYCSDFPNVSSRADIQSNAAYINCNKPLNITTSATINDLCAKVRYSTARYVNYGAIGTGLVNIIITE